MAELIYEIRPYRPHDVAEVAAIFPASIRGLAGQFYSSKQVAAWADRAQSVAEVTKRCADGRHVWVAVNVDDCPVAFIDLEDNGHVDMLFCLPEHARRGLATRLHAELELEARIRDIAKLSTNASEIAKPIFEQWGYVKVKRNDFVFDGIAIHNYSMEKKLRQQR